MKFFKKSMLFLLIGSQFFQEIPSVFADTVEEIEEKKQTEQLNGAVLEAEIDTALTEINQLNGQIDALKKEMATKKMSIEETTKEIAAKKVKVEKMEAQTKARMRTLQTTNVNENYLVMLLEAESFSDFLSRAFAIHTLQDADNKTIDHLKKEKDQLSQLKEDLAADTLALESKSVALENKYQESNQKITSLQEKLDQNKDTLMALDQQKAQENQRLQAEKDTQNAIAVAKEIAEKQEQEKVQIEEAPKEETKTEEPAKPPVTPPDESKGESETGKTLTVVATAYSYQQPGLSPFTATGIDLRANPMVIAVDPAVISLGKNVSVPGRGLTLAGDTGGGIIGNHIDVHFSTVDEAHAWGRKVITIQLID